MKKTFCLSFLLFATTICFSAPAGSKSALAGNQIDLKIRTVVSDIPWPVDGCKKTPGNCPPNPGIL
jgi:hypothetical protein